MTYRARPGILRATLVAAAIFLTSSPSYAYLDPGTGSIILQSILAGIAVAIGFLRFYWQRFRAFLSSLTGSANQGSGNDKHEIAPDSDTGNST